MDLFNLYFKLIYDNKDIVFAWVPGHVGLWGNSVVDLAVKHAREKPVNKTMAVPYSDFKVLTNMYITPEHKLYKIQPIVADTILSHGWCLHEETVLCRLPIGHTY